MAKKVTKKKRINTIITIACLGASVFLMGIIYSDLLRVNSQKDKLVELTKIKEQLQEERDELAEEVKNLDDPEYVARYARDNYIFPSEGEDVIKLPEVKE